MLKQQQKTSYAYDSVAVKLLKMKLTFYLIAQANLL